MTTFIDLMQVYVGSDGAATKSLYDQLEKLGPAGAIAIDLFRAEKASERAKKYRGGNGHGSYRRQAYDKKQWCIDNLAKALAKHAPETGLVWGWGEDPKQEFHRFVLYVELPTGQVSFHTAPRGDGPDYSGQWDEIRGMGPTRVCRWIVSLFQSAAVVVANTEENDMSWSFSGIGKPLAVAAKAREAADNGGKPYCAEPEETIRKEALEVVAKAASSLNAETVVQVNASGSMWKDGEIVRSQSLKIEVNTLGPILE